jgi:hypothetical protein
VISFIALKYEADIAADPISAGQAITPPPGHLCVISNIYFLSIHAPENSTLPTAIQFDGIDVPGLLFATRRGDRYLVAGHAPALLGNLDVIRTVCLSTSGQRTTLRLLDRPLRVQKGDEALMMVMDLLGGPDRGGALTFILRVLSSLGGNLDAPLALMVRNILRAHATERDARAYVLDGQHLYWRVALPKGHEHPACVAVRCFFLRDQQLVQVSCGKALRTAAGGLHMLSRKPSTAENGSLIVVIGSLIVLASVRPMPRNAALGALGAILSGQADDPLMIKRYLLSRCAELYRAHKSADVLALGNQIWAQTPFASQAVVRPDMDFGGSIERILPVPGKGLLIVGWLLDPHRLLDHLEVIDGQGRLGRLNAHVFRHDRPDVRKAFPDLSCEAPGFITFHPSAAVSDLWPTYQVKGVLKSGAPIGFATDLKASRRSLVSAEIVLGLVPAEKATPSSTAKSCQQ